MTDLATESEDRMAADAASARSRFLTPIMIAEKKSCQSIVSLPSHETRALFCD